MSEPVLVDGVRGENRLNAFVPANCEIKPLRDQMIVEPLEWEPSKVIKVIWQGKPLRGRVLAVGPGCYPLKYDGPKGQRTKSWRSRVFVPTSVKVGDIVELGGLELRGYLHKWFYWGDKRVILCQEADFAFVSGAGS